MVFVERAELRPAHTSHQRSEAQLIGWNKLRAAMTSQLKAWQVTSAAASRLLRASPAHIITTQETRKTSSRHEHRSGGAWRGGTRYDGRTAHWHSNPLSRGMTSWSDTGNLAAQDSTAFGHQRLFHSRSGLLAVSSVPASQMCFFPSLSVRDVNCI